MHSSGSHRTLVRENGESVSTLPHAVLYFVHIAVRYERFVSDFAVYNRFDILEFGFASSHATNPRDRSGVVSQARLHDPASIFLAKRENR
jgi:hypothetical protein